MVRKNWLCTETHLFINFVYFTFSTLPITYLIQTHKGHTGPKLRRGGLGGVTFPQKFHSEVQSAEFYFRRQTKIFLDTKQYYHNILPLH